MSNIENPHINPLGFREYDARWLYPKDINLEGIKNVGLGFGTQIISKKSKNPRVIVGHDYRSYSEKIKKKLIEGLVETGCNIEDIGLCLSPTAYFAQLNLNADAVAMVTASHNENGWTGIKMGIEKGLTHSPNEMNELKDIVLKKNFINGKGSYKEIRGFKEIYISSLTKNKINKKIKVVIACGNGTAGAFAPKVFKDIGCEVVELDCNLDFNFPKYNPNPEDLKMLKAIGKSVKENKADVGFGFDGDGDRVGVIDNNGNEIFSDKVGLLIARNLSSIHKKEKFIDCCFDAYWKDNIDISKEENLKKILSQCEIDQKKFNEGIKEIKIKNKLKDLTSLAFNNDVFGAPTFVVNNKLFWGQDRLNYALEEYNS